MMKIRHSLKIMTVGVLALTAVACGGSNLLDSNDNKGRESSISVALKKTTVTSTSTSGTETVQAEVSCNAGDIFANKCEVTGTTVKWAGQTTKYPDHYTIAASKSVTLDIPLITDSDRILAPLSYLQDVNPSTAKSDWTVHSEIIGKMNSKLITFGAADPKQFTTTIPPYMQGTLQVTDGQQTLNETSYGVLTGSGSGYIDVNNKLVFYLNQAPAAGAVITAKWIDPLSALSFLPKGDDMKIVYGSLTLTQQMNLLIDDDGIPYAMIDGQNIIPVKPWGFNNAAVAVRYSGGAFNAYGGEIVGQGDGIAKTYTVRTQYTPLLKDSVKVFTAKEQGQVQFYNMATGEITVTFTSPPSPDDVIKASYAISVVRLPIDITLETNQGQFLNTVVLEVTR